MFYDPMCVLQPILINLKKLLQNLCKQKFEWDENISGEFNGKWNILSNLGNVKTTETLRKVLNHDEGYLPQRVDLYGFGDVSQQRHGAWIYLKSVFNRASAFAHLLTSKSRLVPIKESAIPRLELLDNLILRGSLHG